jgi:hypothetical protein
MHLKKSVEMVVGLQDRHNDSLSLSVIETVIGCAFYPSWEGEYALIHRIKN